MPKLRLFIAIDTPPDIKAQIVALQKGLQETRAEVRWEPDGKLHATIKFLGDTDEGKLAPIVSALEEIGGNHGPITVSYRTIGCFPDMHAPRVVWVGIEDSTGRLQALQENLQESMKRFGFEQEKRKFHPHLTLGRVKGAKNLHSLLAMLKTVTFESQPVIIREMILVKSDLRPSGSVYTTLKAIPLKD